MSDSAHIIYWKNSLKLTPMYSIAGYSRAAESTGFYCKELEMAFDAGIQTNDQPAYICLTHLHNDHSSALNKMLIDNPKNPIIFIPNNNKFEELLITTLRYIYLSSKFIHPQSTKGADPKSKYNYQIIKLDIGQSYKFRDNKSITYHIEGLPSDHGVASISFGIYEMRKRCKPEYNGLDEQQYVKLKEDGIEFTEIYKHPIVCYMSDTNHAPFYGLNSNLIYQYPYIIIECTFFEKNDLKHAKKKNHIHWDNLQPIVLSYPKIKFILIHFSKKYTWKHVKNFFDQINSSIRLNNVILWLYSGIVDYEIINSSNTNMIEFSCNINK